MLRICLLIGVAFCGSELRAWSQSTTRVAIGRDFRLSVSGSPGVAVTIETTSSLSPADWVAVTNITLASDLLSLSAMSPTDKQHFYRVQPPPVANPVPEKLVWIPPGTFTMGSPVDELHRDLDEGPQTVVTLTKGFYICRHLVTQADYLAIMGTNPSRYRGSASLPVEA